jgi:hypothetical protein
VSLNSTCVKKLIRPYLKKKKTINESYEETQVVVHSLVFHSGLSPQYIKKYIYREREKERERERKDNEDT